MRHVITEGGRYQRTRRSVLSSTVFFDIVADVSFVSACACFVIRFPFHRTHVRIHAQLRNVWYTARKRASRGFASQQNQLSGERTGMLLRRATRQRSFFHRRAACLDPTPITVCFCTLCLSASPLFFEIFCHRIRMNISSPSPVENRGGSTGIFIPTGLNIL